MKKNLGVCLWLMLVLLFCSIQPSITVKAAASDPLATPVYVGGQPLQYAGDSVEGNGGGTATLYCTSAGLPVLVLDNYVYEGNGYEYADDCYAGIYYSGNSSMYIILGSGASGQASENSITITAANATESYGIYKDSTNYLGNLFIDGSNNNAADTLTVIGGSATNQSSGIKVTNGLKNNSKYSTNVTAYTSKTAESTTMFYMDGNFTVTATGGTVTGEGAYSVGIDLVQGASWNESVFDKGTFNATGGEASNGISYGIRNSVVNNEATDLYFEFTGATVTATGGTGKSGSYGITGNTIDITGGTVTANAGNSTGGTDASRSAGISCTTLNVSGGTVNATGGTAAGFRMPKSYGINCSGDATFSGGKITATGGKASYEGVTAATPEAKTYGINAATISISGAEVTAIGGTCGAATSGTKGNDAHSYGCYGDITMDSGSLTATGADLLEEAAYRVKESYGIYGSLDVSGGTVIATGGNTINGYCYGIYATGDCAFSGTADVTIKTNDVNTDDYLYGLYLKNLAITVTVADSAKVDITVETEGAEATYGFYAGNNNNKYVQTGGTVTVSAPSRKANQYGVSFTDADISDGTFSASAKGTAFYAYDLNLTGGDITGTSTSTLEDTMSVVSTGIKIKTLTMTGGSLTGKGGKHTTRHSYGVYLTGTANVSGGTITGTGGHVYSETIGVMSYGVNIEDGTLTLSGGTVTGIGGQASDSSFGVYVASNATLSEEAVLEGNGGVSDRGNSTGISLSGDFTMSADSSAQITGNGGSGANSMGIKYAGSTLSLLGGSLTATGGTGTTASYGLYTINNFLMDGTLLTAKGNTSAVGCDSNEEISSEVIVVSADIAGTSTSPLQYGGHVISTLAEYKYLKAGTTDAVGAEPGKRDISGATITLASSSLTYSGSEQTMEVTSVNLGSVELLDEVTISGNTATNVGTYTLTVTAKDSSYYTGSVTKTFTVNSLKIEPDVTVKGDSYAWKSTVDPSDVTVKYGAIVLELNKDYTIESYINNVGEDGGYVRVYPMSGSNYTWNNWINVEFDVVRAENPVEVTTPVTVIRGGNWVNLEYSNNQASTTPSYSFDGDDLGCKIETGTLTSGDTQGTVTVKATFPVSEFYNEAVRTITVTITDKNRAELANVNIADTNYQYDDATKLAQVYHSGSGSRVKEDIIEYSGTTRSGATYERSTTAPTQAGNYTVYVTYETRDTIYTGSDDFVIKPKNIANLITVTLGDALTYNGTEQTQTVTEVCDVTADYDFDETEYTITGNKQTNAGYYSLDITGIGNFTGRKTVSYEIAKATPTLGDFEIPAYEDTVDYTGEYIEITPPTSTKNGMGDTYIETYVRNAGTYNITFNVYEGTNYTAASGFTYGTITVNKVYHNISTTDAVVGINGKMIDLNERVTGEENIGATFTIVAGDDLGCTINGRTFFSGSKAGNVTVQVTVPGDNNYLETISTFTVEVVEVGGVKVWGGVNSSGSSSDENTIQLLKDDEVKYELTILGNSIEYSFDGVAAGTYTLRVSKANHITVEKEVTVASEDVHVDVELVLKEFAFIAANVIMGNNLDMMFAIQSLTTADWSDYYVRIERTYANGNSNDIRIIPYSQWGTSGSYRTVTYTGLAAKEMCDVITLTVCDGEGNAVSEPWVDSMQDYATRIINKESSIALQKSMLVDMLNYGSVAQQRFGYGTDNLANSLLTVEQKGYASGEQEVSKKLTQGDKWAASNLIMESNIRLLVAIRGLTADMTATVEFTNHYGKNISIDVPGSKFGTSGTMKYIEVNQLVIADARQPITITVYNADETVYTVCQDSIEDYLARKDSGDALVAAVMKFAYSAYAYLHR